MRERVRVECAWFLALSTGPADKALSKLPLSAHELLVSLAKDPEATDVPAIKQIESRTNHDVKAVEYWAARRVAVAWRQSRRIGMDAFRVYFRGHQHLAYALMLKRARATLLLPMLEDLGGKIDALAARHAGVSMLARTHGQTATPTTVGKELANVAARLEAQRAGVERVAILGENEWCGRQFQCTCGRLAARRLAAIECRIRRVIGIEVKCLYHSDRAPRLDCRILSRTHSARTRCCWIFARYVELHIDGLLQAAPRRRRSRLFDHAPQGQSH